MFDIDGKPTAPSRPHAFWRGRRRGAACRLLVGLSLASGIWQATPAAADPGEKISDGVVKIGLLLDMSSLFADITGAGSVYAAQMAVDDFGGKVLGKPIELVYFDHQNRADLAASKAREWFDTGKVDVIGDVAGSATALAALEVAREKNKLILMSAPGSSRLTNEDCSPISVHYAWDTYALAAGTARGVMQAGGKDWFFITADYAFGQSLQKDASDAIQGMGGTVVGSVKHPVNTADFSSFILQAMNSKAQVVALANAGGDTVNAIRSANQFGLTKKQQLAGLTVFINDINALGLATTHGMLLTESFYWDMNDETRKWSRRYFEKMKKMPNMMQAGVYSSTLHYLEAVKAAGTDETAAVMVKFKSMPINDMYVKNGHVREDGQMMREMYVFEVKQQSESNYPWDYYKLKATIPADTAYRSLADSKCPLLGKP